MKKLPLKRCKQCNNFVKRQNIFCNSSCSASYNNLRKPKRSIGSRLKTSNSLKLATRTRKYNPRTIHQNTCKQCFNIFQVDYKRCHVKYCSPQCLLIARQNIGRIRGRKTAATQTIRSKNEILFSEFCFKAFNNVTVNQPMFNGWDADIIIHDKKIAILWNGKWHYEKITKKHSVKQVQNRDAIKIKEIINCGYTPLIIKDMGSYNPKFVEEEFKKFIGDIA